MTVRGGPHNERMERAIDRPDGEAAFSHELLRGLIRATGVPVSAALSKLVNEVATADELLIDLVRNAYLEHNPVERARARDDVLNHLPPGLDVTTTASIAHEWRTLDVFDLGGARGHRGHPRRPRRDGHVCPYAACV